MQSSLERPDDDDSINNRNKCNDKEKKINILMLLNCIFMNFFLDYVRRIKWVLIFHTGIVLKELFLM